LELSEILFDTTILVDYLRGVEASKIIVERIRAGELTAHISALTEAELFAGKECDNEMKRSEVHSLISLFTKHEIDNEICQLAGQYKRHHAVPLDDCLIAATAYILNTEIFTKNLKEFKRIKDVRVKDPY
jgi:tRNA(fMet)-specific endonuclease VapC